MTLGKFKYISIALVIISLSSFLPTDDWKELDLKVFKMSIPSEWNYKQEQGDDSFVGELIGSKCILTFDYSNQGYADNFDEIDDDKDSIKQYYIRLDSNGFYKTKTIWSKNYNKGLTGIYIHSRSSHLSFQMSGFNLNKRNQQLALQAFKTIKLNHR